MKENQPKKGSGAERALEWVDPNQEYRLTDALASPKPVLIA